MLVVIKELYSQIQSNASRNEIIEKEYLSVVKDFETHQEELLKKISSILSER